jgi:hypothetical protein
MPSKSPRLQCYIEPVTMARIELVWKVRQDFPVFEWISAVCDLPVLARHAMKA